MRPPVEIHDCSLRDAVGDFVTSYIRAHELGEVIRLLDKVGFASIDGFGGYSVERLLRVAREDPWERLRAIRRAMSRTPLQAVVRGRMLFGGRPAPDATVRAALQHLRNLGVDNLKVSDPGLDIEGAKRVISLAKLLGFRVTAATAVSWGQREEPRDTLLAAAAAFAEAGADEISLQDPLGILPPAALADVVSSYCRVHTLPLRLHVHDASLLSAAGIEAGLRAGAAAADATVSALAWAYSPPRTESLLMTLRGSAIEPHLDLGALEAVSAWFVRAKERKGFGYKVFYGVDHAALRGEMPSTVRHTLVDKLHRRGRSDLFPAAWDETPRVWEALGNPPLLTPFLEAVVGQAIENVLASEPFAVMDTRVCAYLRGLYGPPRPTVRADLVARAAGEDLPCEEPLPEVEAARPGENASAEELLNRALFPDLSSWADLPAPAPAEAAKADASAESKVPRRLLVDRQGESYEVVLEGIGPLVGQRRTLFLRIGNEAASVEVTFPAGDGGPTYALRQHGREHQVKFLEILRKGKRALPVLLREDGQLVEVLYSFPKLS